MRLLFFLRKSVLHSGTRFPQISMRLSALRRLTLLDFPKTPACIVFLPGCPFRCHYCHNSEFVIPEKLAALAQDFIPEEVFFRFLETRKGLLEGIVVSGGEPTIHADLPDFLRKIREKGFCIKLDTNGVNPQMLRHLLSEHLLDYVAMDIKASPEKYSEFCGTTIDFAQIQESKNLLEKSGIPVEFRTTLVREFHDESEFLRIVEFLRGAKKYTLQNFQNRGGTLNPSWEQYSGFTEAELREKQKIAQDFVVQCDFRF